MIRLLKVFLLLCAIPSMGYAYTINTGGIHQGIFWDYISSHMTARQDLIDTCEGGFADGACLWYEYQIDNNGAIGYSIKTYRCADGFTPQNIDWKVNTTLSPTATCGIYQAPNPEDYCQPEATYRATTNSGYAVGEYVIDPNDCCQWEVKQTATIGTTTKEFWKSLGIVVGCNDGPPPTAEWEENENCIWNEEGKKYCYFKNSDNCGWYAPGSGDDAVKMVCFADDTCVESFDGVVTCDNDLPAPPAPMTPEGEPVPSDAEISTNEGTWDIYNPITITDNITSGGIGGGSQVPYSPVDPVSGVSTSQLENICKTNPDALACKVQTLSAACGQPDGTGYSFVCAGDEVLCYQAETNHRLMCYQERLIGDFNSASAAAKSDPDHPENFDLEAGLDELHQEVDLDEFASQIEIDESGFLGASSCPAGQTLSLLGASYTLEYQPICDVVEQASPFVLVAFSFIGFVGFRRVAFG